MRLLNTPSAATAGTFRPARGRRLSKMGALALAGLLALPLSAAARDRSDSQAQAGATEGEPLRVIPGPKRTVAVAKFTTKSDFQNLYGLTDVGGGLAAMLTSALIESGHFLVVERADLSSVFSEQELGSHGLVNAESRPEVGRLVGAQWLVVGSVTEFSLDTKGKGLSIGFGKGGRGIGLSPQKRSGAVGIDVRVIDTTTAEVVASFTVLERVSSRSIGLSAAAEGFSFGSQKFQKTPLGAAARAAIRQAARQFADAVAEVAWTGRVVDFDAGEVVINAGSEAGLRPGDRFAIRRVSKVLTDPVTGRVLGQRKASVGTVVIEDVEGELAFGGFETDGQRQPMRGDLVTLR